MGSGPFVGGNGGITGGGIPIAVGEGVKFTVRCVIDRATHGNHQGEDPFQVGASCLEGGKEDHQDREASSREGGNQDQEGRADGLRKVVKLHCKISESIVRLTSTESRRGRGPAEPTRRTHTHGRAVHGWRRTEMLRTETETPRRGTVARFISSRNLINDTLGLVVS